MSEVNTGAEGNTCRRMARLGMRFMLAKGAPVHGSVFRSCTHQHTTPQVQ